MRCSGQSVTSFINLKHGRGVPRVIPSPLVERPMHFGKARCGGGWPMSPIVCSTVQQSSMHCTSILHNPQLIRNLHLVLSLNTTSLSLPMAPRMLSIFAPFSLQLGSNAQLHQQAQTMIWYAESHFRQALIKISQADHRDQAWMQRCLLTELVSVPPSYIPTQLMRGSRDSSS